MELHIMNKSPANSVAKRAALAAAMFGCVVVTLDAQVTNVALPAIHSDLGGGLAGLQWVVTGYTLMFSALLLFGGTLSDRIGSRRAYGYGMVLFVAAQWRPGLRRRCRSWSSRAWCKASEQPW